MHRFGIKKQILQKQNVKIRSVIVLVKFIVVVTVSQVFLYYSCLLHYGGE